MSGRQEVDAVDVLVVGAGVAGLSTALGLHAAGRRVLLVSAGEGSTGWAQGGVAAAFADGDDPVEHARDTAVAGAGVCDARALDCLVEEGPQRLAELLGLGARFDRHADGRLDRTREGGHHRHRVVHAGGDATGAEVLRALAAATRASGLEWREGFRVVGLTRGRPSNQATGVPQVTGALLEGPSGRARVDARAVVLATGGIGSAYAVTTNPAGVTGEGAALALLAGAGVRDAEFVQFHPTALHVGHQGQVPLVSEALRGEGAVLRDHAGAAFMAGRHPLADLAPRDVVARAVHQVMSDAGSDHVWLDATAVPDVLTRFPTIAASCAEVGLDPSRDWLPVSPAEHFWCGGVATDRWGATDVPGLLAVGEVAATGVHGGNRLASNSLLEGLVFGRRAAARLALELPAAATADLDEVVLEPDAASVAEVRALLSEHAGVVRTGDGLARAAALLADGPRRDPARLVAAAVVAAALARQESRGAHFRADHPETSPRWQRHLTVRLDADGLPVVDGVPEEVAGPAGSAGPVGPLVPVATVAERVA